MSELRVAERLDDAGARALAGELGLRNHEVDAIFEVLGRPPGRSELTMFAGMWSEHCSYKSTRQWLKDLPKDSPRVLAGPGSHAGTVDVGEGWAVAFKIESHNHPSAVEPYQGAATGVGGILRDIVAQGARPVAVMDSLCFGDPASRRTRFLAKGVVDGIAGYGNAYGVPNVGGKTVYDARYEGNPLVNAMAAGLVRHDGMRTAAASGVGNALLYVGATTGRDGILGAAFASEELSDETSHKRSHVQVGDPFMGKKLMEALMAFGPEQGLVAGQDMGACGISCAVTEMAAAGEVGFQVDLTAVPLREDDMAPHEVLLSESQERFLLVVEAERAEEAVEHFESRGVHAALLGRVIEGERVSITWGDELVADLPAVAVADGSPLAGWTVGELPEPAPYPPKEAPADLSVTLTALLADPNLSDHTPVTSRYDQTVGNRTVRGPGDADAAVLKLPASTRGFALALEGRGETCAADPRLGVQAALAACVRDLACVGAEAVAVTDGLNMGSPSDPVENARLQATIEGLGEGLTALGIPVTGGNASLFNESPKGAIPPTPMVGALGLVEDVRRVPRSRVSEGQVLLALGGLRDDPVTSRYGRWLTGEACAGTPAVDLDEERALAGLLRQAIAKGWVSGAKAAGLGGLGVALAKLCLRSGVGASVELPRGSERPDWMLFGEYPAQAWVACDDEGADALEVLAAELSVPFARAGRAGGTRVAIADHLDVDLGELAASWKGAVQ